MWKSILSPILVILAVLIIPTISEALFYLPLIFALSVSLINHSKFRIKIKSLGIFLFVLQTYLVFLGLAVTTYISDDLIDHLSLATQENFALRGIVLVTLGGYLAAMLLFFFSTFLFAYERKRKGYLILSICYAFIVLVMQIFTQAEFLQFGVEKFTSYLISWMIFMSLGFSLTLNLHDFKKVLK